MDIGELGGGGGRGKAKPLFILQDKHMDTHTQSFEPILLIGLYFVTVGSGQKIAAGQYSFHS